MKTYNGLKVVKIDLPHSMNTLTIPSNCWGMIGYTRDDMMGGSTNCREANDPDGEYVGTWSGNYPSEYGE